MNKCTVFTTLFIWRKTRSHVINHHLIYKTFLTVIDSFRAAKSHDHLSPICPLNMKLCANKVKIKNLFIILIARFKISFINLIISKFMTLNHLKTV